MKEQSPGDVCPYCQKGILELMEANEPWSIEHLMCDECNSTYPYYENIKDKLVPIKNL